MQNGGKKVYPSIDTSTHGSIRKHQHSRSSVTGSILNCCHDVKLSEAPFQKPTSQKTEGLQDEEKYEGNDDEVILVCLLFITVFEDFVISTYGYTFSVLQGVMVPGVIPSNVKPLQSRVQAGVIPRYQQALVRILQSMFTCARANYFICVEQDELLQARGDQRSARLAFAQVMSTAGTWMPRSCLLQHLGPRIVRPGACIPAHLALTIRGALAVPARGQ